MDTDPQTPSLKPREYFATTRWTLVLSAAGNDTGAREALEKLCQAYWPPLYAYVRRRGYSIEDAQDLTQEFFSRLLQGQWLARADEARGRFRTFLLTALQRFLANEWDKARTLKRGGAQRFVPVQLEAAETRYGVDPADDRTPEQAFEKSWAMALLERAVGRLEDEYRANGELQHFDQLKPCLVGASATQPYAELARELDMSETAVKVAIHRFRLRYRELLRAEIAETVFSPAEVDAEMHHLFNVLTSR